jgi:hypothetical protein
MGIPPIRGYSDFSKPLFTLSGGSPLSLLL